MATLTIDEITLDVVGVPSWSEGRQPGAVPFIEARVRVPGDRPTKDLDRENAHVVLNLDGGGNAEGFGLWLVGGLRSNGDVALVRFEGVRVVKHP
jgi:hypothetical protein